MMMLVVNSFLFRTTIGYHPPTIHKTYGMDWMHFLFLLEAMQLNSDEIACFELNKNYLTLSQFMQGVCGLLAPMKELCELDMH